MQKAGEKETILEDTQQDLNRIGAADVVLGVPTYNNRETIARTVEASIAALSDHLSGRQVVLINADGNSRDGTAEYLREIVGERIPLLQVRYPVYPVDRLSAPLAGVPGRQEAALVTFQLARQLGAKVCALLDAEVESITPEWIDRLARPVLEGGVDLVVPVYLRRKFDGLINSGILSPFARALFGKRVRQPVGADLAFSAGSWISLSSRRIHADAGGGSVEHDHMQSPTVFASDRAFWDHARCARAKSAPALSNTLQQVLAGLFEQMEHSAAFWQKVRGSERGALVRAAARNRGRHLGSQPQADDRFVPPGLPRPDRDLEARVSARNSARFAPPGAAAGSRVPIRR